jgi:predicted acylesterase/phospholipase RssA
LNSYQEGDSSHIDAGSTGVKRHMQDENVQRATEILRGANATPEEMSKIAEALKKIKKFGLARKLLARARVDPLPCENQEFVVKLGQQHALCTYKDPDLPADFRFDRAVEILKQVSNLETTRNPETLGIAGAIFKNKWEAFAQKGDLERSLAYYLRGYNFGDQEDYGYTGINAAYVLDLLAAQESVGARAVGAVADSAVAKAEQARKIREDLLVRLPAMLQDKSEEWLKSKWWFLVTVAEAAFGAERYVLAREYLERAMALQDVAEWEYESTARQLASLARIHWDRATPNTIFEESEPWKVVKEFLGDRAAGVRSAFIGKVGLALSGGGFRAALFHIGVLARLAELDVLRNVEFLSCVSGGSIVGAHYYLEIKKLLTEKKDLDIERRHYIEIVERVERDFLAGVQRNIRCRVAANPLTNLKMAFSGNYSRTMAAGDLFESEIYSRVKDSGGKERYMDELLIVPNNEVSNFEPKYHNWRRSAKVPVLILNGTCLNTGHNWQFTASWMGEPPAGIDAEIDGNYRLRRMYYPDAPPKHRKVRLGRAVAASACVPGLFDPVAFETLYPDKVVRLVDGGVHDNQGITSLIEAGCSVILVSDASGQMESQDNPGESLVGVPLRSNSVLQARVRQAQYHELDARRRSLLLRGLMFVHLKKDLDVDPVDWVGCEDPYDASDEARSVLRRGVLTKYGIRKDVQRKLAAIRTDLDSFSEVEAYALMTSGYRMTEYDFPVKVPGFHPTLSISHPWRFLQIEQPMKQGRDNAHERMMTLLGVSDRLSFKVWYLVKGLRIAGAVLAVIAASLYLGFCILALSQSNGGGVSWRSFGMAGLLLAVIVAFPIIRKLRLPGVGISAAVTRVGIGLGIGIVGWVAARIHLLIFDRLFLRLGKLEALHLPVQQPQPPRASSASA